MEKVQLSEREVQIWFQNRRQNDRRRSKPLEPHELLAHIHGANRRSSSVSTSLEKGDSETRPEAILQPNHAHPSSSNAQTLPIEENITSKSQSEPTSSAETAVEGQKLVKTQESSATQTPPSSVEITESPRETRPAEQHSEGSDGSSGRKRSHQEMVEGDRVEDNKSPCPPKSKEPLKRSSSVRLSMTAEGAVKIRTKDELTPSPEKPRAEPPAGKTLKKSIRPSRSISMFEDITSIDVQPPAKPRIGPGFGRSRDARTWEFYCDSKAKDVLSEQAEAERSGSAIGAINLIRSNAHKPRGPALSPLVSGKNVKLGSMVRKQGKPMLARSQSSVARLQSDDTVKRLVKPIQKPTQPVHSPSGDSDKENWAPGTRTSHNALRRTEPSTNHRSVLQDSESTADVGKLSQHDRTEGEEMACVEGLLSLSQAAWQ